jgi:hypothetical protein
VVHTSFSDIDHLTCVLAALKRSITRRFRSLSRVLKFFQSFVHLLELRIRRGWKWRSRAMFTKKQQRLARRLRAGIG